MPGPPMCRGPDATSRVEYHDIMARKLWGVFMFLLVLGSLGACGYLYTLLRQEQTARVALEQQINGFGPRFDQFKEAVRGVDRQLAATVFQEVDLGATGWQPITGGLYV